jgi:O-antigen ligase
MKYIIYIFLILSIPLLPRFNSIDVIGVHWLALSIINFSFLFYLIAIDKSFEFFRFLKSIPLVSYLIFVFISLISFIYSKNLNLSVVDLSRILNTLFTIFILLNFFSKYFSFFNLSLLISFFLIFDIFFAFKPYLQQSISLDQNFITFFIDNYQPSFLKGLNGNKNITAAYTLIKLPFLFYVLFKSKSKKLILSAYFILFFMYLLLFLLVARAALLSLIIISLFFLIFLFFKNRNQFFKVFVVLIFSFIFSNILITQSTKGSNSLASELSSINFSNESSNSRFLLWENAVDALYSSNFIGFGLGTWKVESLPYWNKNGSAYIVPYHAHNDFFELSAELGLLGSLSYLFVFLSLFLILFKSFLIKYDFKYSVIFMSLLVYFIDANLNFPLERTSMQVFFALILALSIHLLYHEKINSPS